MEQRRIQPVKDNRDKQRTYQEQMKRHKRAMDGEFYFEAIMIDYALMEDRLHSMLYHMGFLADRMAFSIYRKHRPALVEMVTACMGEDAAKKLGISNITGKLKILRSVLHWSAQAQPEDPYLSTLAARYRTLNAVEVEKILDDIVGWCGYRNEIVHAMMNKNMDSLSESLNSRAQEGMQLVRRLDAQVQAVKKGNRIRLSAGLPTDR